MRKLTGGEQLDWLKGYLYGEIDAAEADIKSGLEDEYPMTIRDAAIRIKALALVLEEMLRLSHITITNTKKG